MIGLVLKLERQTGSGWFWLLPCFVLPAALGGGMIGLARMNSRRQRLVVLKYLVIYLPTIAIPIAVQSYGELRAQLWAWGLSLLAQLLVQFWYGKRLTLVQREEAGLAVTC